MAAPVTPESFQAELLSSLRRIANALERLANDGKPIVPDLRKPISEYKNFDWSTIDASVIARDADGPTHLEWGGFVWMRRSPSNKYAPAIWFSRCIGKNEEGDNQYGTLIKFEQPKDVESVSKKAAQAAEESAPKAPAQPPATPGRLVDPVAEYITWATGKELNLSREAAQWVLDQVHGVVETARILAPLAAEAKGRGMANSLIMSYMRSGDFNPEKCRKIFQDLRK